MTTSKTALIERISELLQARDLRLITAESCTGGLIAAEFTAVAGCSGWFEGGFVTYQPAAKERMIGVRHATIERYGVVSEPTVREMAEGALAASEASISVAVTGIAGPDGGDTETPVGTVWFGWALRDPQPVCVHTARHQFSGDRAAVREQAVRIALEGVLAVLNSPA